MSQSRRGPHDAVARAAPALSGSTEPLPAPTARIRALAARCTDCQKKHTRGGVTAYRRGGNADPGGQLRASFPARPVTLAGSRRQHKRAVACQPAGLAGPAKQQVSN